MWTVLTHLFRVRRSSHVPSPLRRPQQQRLTVSVPPGNTKLGLDGEQQTRFDRRFDRSPGHIDRKRTPLRTCHGLWFAVHATSSGPLWCTGTGLQLWSVVCGVRGLPFLHIKSYHIISHHTISYGITCTEGHAESHTPIAAMCIRLILRGYTADDVVRVKIRPGGST